MNGEIPTPDRRCRLPKVAPAEGVVSHRCVCAQEHGHRALHRCGVCGEAWAPKRRADQNHPFQ